MAARVERLLGDDAVRDGSADGETDGAARRSAVGPSMAAVAQSIRYGPSAALAPTSALVDLAISVKLSPASTCRRRDARYDLQMISPDAERPGEWWMRRPGLRRCEDSRQRAGLLRQGSSPAANGTARYALPARQVVVAGHERAMVQGVPLLSGCVLESEGRAAGRRQILQIAPMLNHYFTMSVKSAS